MFKNSLTVGIILISSILVSCSAPMVKYVKPTPMRGVSMAYLISATVEVEGGSGVIVNHNNQYFIVTAWHVIEDKPEGYFISAKKITHSPAMDLALIEFEINTELQRLRPKLQLADEKPHFDEVLYHCGNPWRTNKTVIFGYYKGEHNRHKDQMEMGAYFGSSGGPIVNRDGKLVGIVSSISESNNMTQFISLKSIKRLIEIHNGN